ncbi:MAG: Wadjet anti-phage system protein JetD domain-containing protein [Candidatus Limimorpha sp.]
MITPAEIKKKAENKYIAYLQSIVEESQFFPLVIVGNKKPNGDTAIFKRELEELIDNSKEKRVYGYTIEYKTVKTKLHGTQDVPTSISFQSEVDYLKFLHKEREAAKFRDDISKIICSFPDLKDWVHKYPSKIVDNNWDDLLKVCSYFKNTPKPNLYIRELPIKVHTKFIENNKGIIRELLDIIISEHINANEKQFEKRYNLRYDEPLVRFRILDSSICQQSLSGVEDCSIPISQFQKLNLPIDIVYVVENKMNLLTFPLIEKSIVVWGHGFGVDLMRDVEWMKTKKMYYWGDLDAHGFQILSEIRTHFPHVESFLMDRETFNKFFMGDKGTETNLEKELCLTHEENKIYRYLKENNYRLEQEKIPCEFASKNIPGQNEANRKDIRFVGNPKPTMGKEIRGQYHKKLL